MLVSTPRAEWKLVGSREQGNTSEPLRYVGPIGTGILYFKANRCLLGTGNVSVVRHTVCVPLLTM